MRGMRNVGHSKFDAISKANEHIRNQFKKAWRLMRAGNLEQSLFEFSVGLHVLQDCTSPAHSGFQEWSDHPCIPAVAGHIVGETAFYTAGQMRALNDITTQAWEWYQNGGLLREGFFPADEEACGCN